MVREGLRGLLQSDPELEVAGEAEDGRSAVALAEELRPDVVVMDVRMPDLNGVDATRQVRDVCPNARVVALSAEADRRATVEMLRAGASGYVLKESAFEELTQAIKT